MSEQSFFIRAGKVLAFALVLSTIVAVAWWDRAVSIPSREAEKLLVSDDFAARLNVSEHHGTSDQLEKKYETDNLADNMPHGDSPQPIGHPMSDTFVSTHLPGGGLPVTPASARSLSRATEPAAQSEKSISPELEEPRRIHVEHAKPIAAAQQPAKLAFAQPQPGGNNRIARAEANFDNSEHQTGVARLAVQVEPVPKFLQTVSHEAVSVSDEHPLFLTARKLHDAESATAARQELLAQGLPLHIISFAQAATDTDWRLRLQVVEAVPRLAGIDSSIWLLHFSQDEVPEVRQAAVAIMATSGDERHRQRLEEIATADADDRVRAQARKATTLR